MSGLARLALELGAAVSGSDRAENSSIAELKELGATIAIGHDSANFPQGAQLVYSSAVGIDNPERKAASDVGADQLHRSELLGEMTNLRRTIAVSGTHGKTTTTAMVVAALRGAGRNPGWMVGAELPGGEPSAGWGSDEWFVIEADESDRSLLNFEAETAVVTNCELDHHATYESLEDLEDTFKQFLEGAANNVVWETPQLVELAGQGSQLVAYEAPVSTVTERGRSFEWRGIQVELQVPGKHNALNAVGALETALLTGADPAGCVKGINAFTGTGRRFERVGVSATGALLIDDYAHHPTEVVATLEAARSVAQARVIAVFQPHLYSRTAAFEHEFGEALTAADRVVVLDIYPARELAEDFPGVTSAGIAKVAAQGLDEDAVSAPGGLQEAEGVIASILQEGDLCVLMGAGDVGSLAERLRA